MIAALHGKRVDSGAIRHAWARDQETIDREQGESIGAFVARACRTFGPDAIVKLANAAGGVVAWTGGGRDIARLIPPPLPRRSEARRYRSEAPSEGLPCVLGALSGAGRSARFTRSARSLDAGFRPDFLTMCAHTLRYPSTYRPTSG